MRLLRSEPSNFASIETIALHIGYVPAPAQGAHRRPAPGPEAGPDWGGFAGPPGPGLAALIMIGGPRQVEASLSRPVPAQPRVGEARTACVAQNHACLLEEEVAEEEVAAAATPLLKYKYHNIYFM